MTRLGGSKGRHCKACTPFWRGADGGRGGGCMLRSRVPRTGDWNHRRMWYSQLKLKGWSAVGAASECPICSHRVLRVTCTQAQLS